VEKKNKKYLQSGLGVGGAGVRRRIKNNYNRDLGEEEREWRRKKIKFNRDWEWEEKKIII
jgi:hypothetical protein